MNATRRFPRRDPYQLFRIQSDFAAGLDLQQVAAKHGMSVPAVTQIVRSRSRDSGLVDPFRLRQDGGRLRTTDQLYWLGYITAAGRLYQRGPAPTLVLDVDPRDVEHVRTLLDDLCEGRPVCEFCQSSRSGLQAYIRDRDLGHLLAQWGVPGANPAEGSVPISLIPPSLLPHFLRGYLEGGRGTSPFGRRSSPASPAAVRLITLTGPEEFVVALRAALSRYHGIGGGTITGRRDGLRLLSYRGRAAKQIMQYAYHNSTRSLPRAARLRQALEGRRNGSHKSRAR